jgi:uncharacterized phage protein (TIGR01671 family)
MKQMKDRYLFKAKTCNGEWVSGFLHCKENKWYISNKAGSPFAFEVRPDTICQCTGLKDKNGKLIWENDIMVAHLDDDYPEDETYIRIMWHGSGFCSKENGSEDIIPIGKFDREHFEVCGNIFDNPDLLEMGV